MIDSRANSIEYSAQLVLLTKLEEVIASKKIGKLKNAAWANIHEAVVNMKAVDDKTIMTDTQLAELPYVYDRIICLLNLNRFPVVDAAVSVVETPTGAVQGPVGIDGPTGPKGDNGGGVDFGESNFLATTTVDSFDISEADGARWDYVIEGSTGKRAGTVIAVWMDDGSAIKAVDQSTPDVTGTTTDIIEFSVIYDNSEIQLVANVVSNTWSVRGTRYWIPNGGNYLGPISNTLTDGKFYIGGEDDIAAEQTISGDITIDRDGVASIEQVITNGHIVDAAGISVNKLEAQEADKIAIYDSDGFLTESTVAASDLLNIAGGDSNFQDQIDAISASWGIVSTASTNYTILAANKAKIHHLTAAGARSVTLPAANAVTAGVPFWIKDAAGTALAANITINRAGSDLFEDGSTALTIQTNRTSYGIYSNGVSTWYVI